MAETDKEVPEGVNAHGERLPPEIDAAGTGAAQAENVVPQNVANVAKPAEEPRIPRSEYEVVASKREEPKSDYMADHLKRLQEEAAAGGKKAGGKGRVPPGRASDASTERANKSASGQMKMYAATGIGLGLLVGLASAAYLLHSGTQGGPSDMGDVNSAEYGLKGHLSTEWKNERLSYHLTVKPITAAQRAGFLAEVNGSPRPLSITIQAKDPFGAVLCGETILLKYDPRNGPAGGSQGPTPKSAKAAEELARREEINRGVNFARLAGLELNRERGKTLFQSDLGADGKVVSISAQGVLPCQKKQVERFASWGFTSDFPILAKPAVIQEAPADPKANVNTAAIEEEAKSQNPDKDSAATKAKKKPTALLPIYVEGDDAIVWLDPSGTVFETSAGKAMLLDKTDGVGSVLKGRDLPIPIHYRCDQSGSCTFSALGLGVHRVKLRR